MRHYIYILKIIHIILFIKEYNHVRLNVGEDQEVIYVASRMAGKTIRKIPMIRWCNMLTFNINLLFSCHSEEEENATNNIWASVVSPERPM
jgi:hypothetical protein